MSNLLFIISQPRSGSTLLQAILSNNKKVNTASEPWILLPFISFENPDIQRGIYNSSLATSGIQDYIKNVGGNHDLVKKSLQTFFKNVYSPLDSKDIEYILDKTPRYYEILPLIIEYFPEAKIIVLKRNPLDVIQSIIATWDVKNYYHLSNYSRDILNGPFLIQKFLDENHSNPNIIEVFYEKLTKEPEKEIKRVYAWLGLEFTEEVLNYKNNNKVSGLMGDKKGFIQKDKIIDVKSPVKWSKFWNVFFVGYLDFLGETFLMRYGNYKFNFKLYPTTEFNDFKFAERLNYFNNNELKITNLLKLIFYKIKSRFKSEYKI